MMECPDFILVFLGICLYVFLRNNKNDAFSFHFLKLGC